MNMVQDHLKVLVAEGSQIPTWGSTGSAGWDLKSNQCLML